MKILAVTSEFPLPADRGGPVRILGLCRGLAAASDFHLLARARPDTAQDLATQLSEELSAPVELFRDSEPGSRWEASRAGRWARAISGGRPAWIDAQHLGPLEHRVRELAGGFDAVVLLDDYAAVYAPAAGDTPTVVDKHNVMGFSAAAAKSASNGLAGRGRQRFMVSMIRRFERGTAAHAQTVVVTSDEEAERFRALYGRRPEAVVPSAIDAPPEAAGSTASVIGWLGSLDYPANAEGLLRFVEEAWEPLGAAGLQLRVAGGNPPPAVRDLERLPGVSVLGFVERMDEFLDDLGAAVIPLWAGAGVKLKTLAFMGAGIPTVATPVALEGVPAEDGRHCLVANDPRGLAQGLRRVTGDADLARALGAQGRALIQRTLTWESVVPAFIEAVEDAASHREGHR